MGREQCNQNPTLLVGPRCLLSLVCIAGKDGQVEGMLPPLNTLRSTLRQLEAIGKLSDDMRRHFRMKLRNLFTKFIRKFGSVC